VSDRVATLSAVAPISHGLDNVRYRFPVMMAQHLDPGNTGRHEDAAASAPMKPALHPDGGAKRVCAVPVVALLLRPRRDTESGGKCFSADFTSPPRQVLNPSGTTTAWDRWTGQKVRQ